MITVGVDIDGVCRDWGGALRQVWYWETGEKLYEEDCHSFDLRKVFQHPTIDVNHLAFDKYVEHICGNAAEVPGSRWGVQQLHEEGYRLVAVTAHTGTLARKYTLDWIIAHGYPFDGIEFTGGDVPKSVVATQINIDDSPDVLNELTAAGRAVVIFDAPYNRHLAGHRATIWQEALYLVRHIANYDLDKSPIVV